MVPLVFLIYFGGYPLMAGVFFVAIVGIRELYKGFNAEGVHPSFAIGYVMVVALFVLNLIFPNQHEYIIAWLVAGVMASSLYLFNITKRKTIDGLATMLGLIYVAFFSFHVVLVDQTGKYSILIWLVFLAAFGTDICAYFTGVFLGKHKLCPNLSPKKTIEGAVGGVIGSVIVSGLFGYFFAPDLTIHCLILGFIASIFSMLGDLTASAYKREMGIKDYGKLIPGHGGIMDRFDSVLYTAPVVYYYILFVLMR